MRVLWYVTWLACIITFFIKNQYRIRYKVKSLACMNSPKFQIVEIFLLIAVFLLITSNRTGGDIYNYRYEYENNFSLEVRREVVYFITRLLSYKVGLSFFEFRALLTFVTGTLAVITIKQIGIDISFFMIFYMPSMLFMDSMQFRNSVANFIIIFSFRYLIGISREENISSITVRGGVKREESIIKKFSPIVKYVICVLIAAQIHTVFYFYLILLIVFLKNNSVYIKVIFSCSVLLIVLSVFNHNRPPFFHFVLNLILAENDVRRTAYLSSGNLGFLVPFSIHILTTFTTYLLNRYIQRSETVKFSFYQKRYISLIDKINFVFFATIPFIMMNIHYYRFVRGAFIMNIIAFAFVFYQKKGLSKRKILILISAIILTVAWYIFDIIIFQVDTVPIITPIWEGKLFFL